MKTLLMCEPDYFEVSYVINPWMANNVGMVNRALAVRQWQQLYATLSRHASIQLISAVAGLPDMVFTANAGLVYPHRQVIVSSFRHRERQGESQYYAKFFADAGYHIEQLQPASVFEGAGDALFDSKGELWFGSGLRSDADAIHALGNKLQAEVNAVTLTDPRWYHLDTAFCPLSGGYALAYKAAFDADSVRLLQYKFGNRLIWVSAADAANFACNAICLEQHIILYRASNELKTTLLGYNFRISEIDVSEFMKSGGSCKCMTLEI